MNQRFPRDRRIQLGAGAAMLWVTLSPWLWGFASSRAAVANHVFMVFSFGPLAAMIVALRPAAIVTGVGGLWLVLSPWILGYATVDLAWLSELIAGGALITLCAAAAGMGAGARGGRRAASRRPLDTPVASSGSLESVG